MKDRITKILINMPSLAWVILIPLLLIAFVGSIIFIFLLIATFEGFASILFLVIGFFAFKTPAYEPIQDPNLKNKLGGLTVAIGIVFFALMGMAIDQTGNFIYNKPVEVFYCPVNTTLSRSEIISNPLPGRTDINQNFQCFDKDAKVIETIGMGSVLLVRFVEYVVIAYALLLLGNSKLFKKERKDANQSILKGLER